MGTRDSQSASAVGPPCAVSHRKGYKQSAIEPEKKQRADIGQLLQFTLHNFTHSETQRIQGKQLPIAIYFN
jgi:hypothetical protein